MKRKETRLENLERAVGAGEDVLVWGYSHEPFVTFSVPVSRRGERALLEDVEREFPDATYVQLVWVDGEEWKTPSPGNT